MTTALNVAKFFVELGTAQAEQETGDAMTNLRVNKLLYFAQGYSMSRLGHPLFSERIEAWEKGPVVPMVYRNYKHCGKNPIEDEPFDRNSVTSEEFNLLFDVYLDTARFSTSELINKTHEPGTPWNRVYAKDENNEIPISLISEYFADHTPPKRTRNPRIKVYKPLYRREDGTPVFPKEALYD